MKRPWRGGHTNNWVAAAIPAPPHRPHLPEPFALLGIPYDLRATIPEPGIKEKALPGRGGRPSWVKANRPPAPRENGGSGPTALAGLGRSGWNTTASCPDPGSSDRRDRQVITLPRTGAGNRTVVLELPEAVGARTGLGARANRCRVK